MGFIISAKYSEGSFLTEAVCKINIVVAFFMIAAINSKARLDIYIPEICLLLTPLRISILFNQLRKSRLFGEQFCNSKGKRVYSSPIYLLTLLRD